MFSLKTSALCAIAAALCLTANTVRAESYGSDAPNAGVTGAKAQAKPKPVKVVNKLYVVHPGVSTSIRKRGK